MRKVALMFCLALVSLPAAADILTCDALKTRVDAKLQAKGVPSYTLEIISTEAPSGTNAASGVPSTVANKGKEVGTCDGGKKRLMYTKGN